MSTTRLETFADGVFAIAATLLILNVEVPELGEHSLGYELLRLWPAYVGYVVSFATIGIIWVNHHTVLRLLRGTDRTFLFINVFFLLCIAFIPFPTRLLATYVRTDDGRAAAVLYGITLTVTALFFNLMWRYAISGGGRLLRADADRREVDGITRSYRPGVPMYAFAMIVGIFQAEVSAALFAAIALFYVLSSSLFGREAADVTIDTGVEIRSSPRATSSPCGASWPRSGRTPRARGSTRSCRATSTRDGFKFLGAFAESRLAGFVYGYRGGPGQWWHDRVAAALGPEGTERWLPPAHLEFTELHVRPEFRRRGIGGGLHDESARRRRRTDRGPLDPDGQRARDRAVSRPRLAGDRAVPRLRFGPPLPDHGARPALIGHCQRPTDLLGYEGCDVNRWRL